MNMNNGYSGYSMSKRACEAYANDLKPISKWTKFDILQALEELNKKINIELLKKLPLKELKDFFLKCEEWHHTSLYCNKTDFYGIDYDYLERIDYDYLLKIKDSYKTKKKIIKKDFIYGIITYEEWIGSKRYGLYKTFKKQAIIVNDWAYTLDFDKKKINAKHMIKVERIGSRKPKNFKKEDTDHLKKRLKMKGII